MRRVGDLSLRGLALALVSTFAIVACGSGGGSTTASGSSCSTVKPSDVHIYVGVGSLSSEYWQEVIKGAHAVADSLNLGSRFTVYEDNFDGQKLLNTFTATLATGGQNAVIVADPASNAFTRPLVQLAQSSGAHIFTLWNRPTEIHPWDFGGGCWVGHTAFDGVESGTKNAGALFDAIGGKGNITALLGIPDDPSAKQRLYGLQQALKSHPDIKVLDQQVGHWQPTEGQQITQTWLGKYGGQMNGIWTANDGMLTGAVEALRAGGKAGKVPITGSDGSGDVLQLISKGDALSTMWIDGYIQGVVSVALAYAAAVGDLNVSQLSHAKRDFYLRQTLVTKSNVGSILNSSFDPSQYTYSKVKQNFWFAVTTPIDDSTWIPQV